MDCTRARSLLRDAAKGFLEVAEREAFDLHLASCQACRTEVEAEQLVDAALSKAWSGGAPESFRAAIAAAAKEPAKDHAPVTAPRPWFGRRLLAVPGGAPLVGVLAIAAALFLFMRGRGTTTSWCAKRSTITCVYFTVNTLWRSRAAAFIR